MTIAHRTRREFFLRQARRMVCVWGGHPPPSAPLVPGLQFQSKVDAHAPSGALCPPSLFPSVHEQRLRSTAIFNQVSVPDLWLSLCSCSHNFCLSGSFLFEHHLNNYLPYAVVCSLSFSGVPFWMAHAPPLPTLLPADKSYLHPGTVLVCCRRHRLTSCTHCTQYCHGH